MDKRIQASPDQNSYRDVYWMALVEYEPVIRGIVHVTGISLDIVKKGTFVWDDYDDVEEEPETFTGRYVMPLSAIFVRLFHTYHMEGHKEAMFKAVLDSALAAAEGLSPLRLLDPPAAEEIPNYKGDGTVDRADTDEKKGEGDAPAKNGDAADAAKATQAAATETSSKDKKKKKKKKKGVLNWLKRWMWSKPIGWTKKAWRKMFRKGKSKKGRDKKKKDKKKDGKNE